VQIRTEVTVVSKMMRPPAVFFGRTVSFLPVNWSVYMSEFADRNAGRPASHSRTNDRTLFWPTVTADYDTYVECSVLHLL
jgi:hypothetical protein